MSFKRELNDSLKSFKVKFFNVKSGAKKKNEEGKAKSKPGEAMAGPEPQPTAKELREQMKAQKPLTKSFVRLTPKVPRLK